MDTPEGQIHYRIGGSGEPLLLLHQSPRSLEEYAGMIPTLVRKKHLIAMDTMGYGESDKPPRPYSIEEHAKTVIMLLDGLGIRRTSIVGNHTGAVIATEVAASYPKRVDKLVLSGVFDPTEEVRQWLLQLKQWTIQEDGSYLIKMFQRGMRQSGNPRIAHQRVVDLLKAGETSEWGHKAVARYPMSERLTLIQSPTLVIWSAEDLGKMDAKGWLGSEGRRKVENALPRGKSVTIPGGAMHFPSEEPAEFARLILQFLEDPGV